MQREKSLKKRDEMIQVWIPRKRMRRPFPLMWGIASLILFLGFAVITQIQFNRVNSDKLFSASIDTYNLEVKVYDDAVRKNEDCLTSIGTREVYRVLFGNVGKLFENSADLPAELLPNSQIALAYQAQMRADVISLLVNPVADQLPPKLPQECPKFPEVRPVRPTRS